MVPDTFRNQTILGTIVGILLLLLGLLKTTSGGGGGPFVGLGTASIFLCGIVRPYLRRHWFLSLRSEDAERPAVARRLVTGPTGRFWRIFLHVDSKGGDLDGIY